MIARLGRLQRGWLLGAGALVVAIGLLAACGLPGNDELPAGWEAIPGGEGTSCALGTPFQFFARTGIDPQRVVVYFQAGGACWSAESCVPNNPLPIYDQTVTLGEFSSYRGAFDFDNPQNPLRDYDMVFVPLCTGDVHVGAATVTYRTAAGLYSLTIQHWGAYNVRAALNWVYERYPNPEQVIVIGSSAGALASLYYSPEIFERYPQAVGLQFSDGYVGVVPDGWDALERWNIEANIPASIAEIGALPPEELVPELVRLLIDLFPDHRFGLYSHAADAFQIAYFGLTGGDTTQWSARRDVVIASYDGLPNLHTYIGAGVLHTILPFDEFYTMEVEGIRFRDWFADFLDGRPVENVHCPRGGVACP